MSPIWDYNLKMLTPKNTRFK